jgi:hypothetical protein
MSALLAGHLVTEDLEREFREFLEAKKRRGEKLRIIVRPVAKARYIPSSPRGFQNFRAACRGVGDWCLASERLDALEDALKRRHMVGLPLPRKVIQNEDRSLTLFWHEASARCFVDGFMSTIGGSAGVPATKITNEFLDLLAFQARIQSAA